MAGHAFRFGKLILETACTETAHAAAGLAAGGMQNSTLTVFILRKPLHAVLCYDYAMNTFDELTRYGIVHLVPILQADSMEYMESLLKSLRPRTFLEIGTAIGRTAIDAASLLPELKVVTIEKDPEMAAIARQNIRKADLEERIVLIEGDALETEIPRQEYDMIFIDAAKGQYQRFFERYSPYLSKDGLILSDNMFFHGLVEHPERTNNRHTKGLIKRLKRYREFLESNEEFETEILDTGDGIAITRRKNA